MMWDIIGTTSLGRVSISEVQRIFGPQAKAMSRDELRGYADHLRGYMNSSMTKVREELQEKKKEIAEKGLSDDDKEKAKELKFSDDEIRKAIELGMSEDQFKENKFKEDLIKAWDDKFKEDDEKSQKFYKDIENIFEVNADDTVKRFGFRFLLYLLLTVIGETYMAGKSTFKEGSK